MQLSEIIFETTGGSTPIDDPIAKLIRRARFKRDDIAWATEAQCASFALALYDTLKTANVRPQLVVCVPLYGSQLKPDMIPKVRSTYDPTTQEYTQIKDNKLSPYAWRHVTIKVGNKYYDIQGERTADQLRRKYGGSVQIALIPVAATAIKADIVSLKGSAQCGYAEGDRYCQWRDSLMKKSA